MEFFIKDDAWDDGKLHAALGGMSGADWLLIDRFVDKIDLDSTPSGGIAKGRVNYLWKLGIRPVIISGGHDDHLLKLRDWVGAGAAINRRKTEGAAGETATKQGICGAA